MKIILISPSIYVKGGISTVIKNYISGGFLNKFDVSIIASHKDVSKFSKFLIAIYSYLKFFILIISFKFNLVVIHSGDIKSILRKIPFIIISKIFHLKIVLHFHGAIFMDEYRQAPKVIQKLLLKALSLTEIIVCLSESWKKSLESILPGAKTLILRNSIFIPNIDTMTDVNNKIIQISFLGLIGERKGIFDLLYVAKELKENNIRICINIAGNGDIRKLKLLIAQLNLKNECKYLGWISNEQRHKLLATTDIFILPSYAEGMPMSIIEAMSYGIPIISTKVGGIPELVEHGLSGFLLEPGNKIELYDYIIQLCTNDALRKEMGKNARKNIEEYHNLKTNIYKLYELYERIANC